MNILIINWRSLNDPAAGGAEQVTFEHAKRWVSSYDAKVTWLSPRYNKDIKQETILGVDFKYVGLPLGVRPFRLLFTFPLFFLLVFFNYLFVYKSNTDIVIEGVHGIPLLTSLYIRKGLFIYLQEVAGNIWDKMFTPPVNILGKFLERVFLLTYSNTPFVVGSESARADLVKVGIETTNVHIVHHGINTPVLNALPKKEAVFTLIFLNRLVKMKGVERALEVFALLKKTVPMAKLWLVGKYNPTYQVALFKLCVDLGISNDVEFLGFVSEETKLNLLQRAHALLNTSYKEGWGLCNIEANSQGTPVIAFDVEGNRDSVQNEVNGYLVPDGDYNAMVDALLKIYSGKTDLGLKALAYSQKYNWDKQAELFYQLLSSAVAH